MVDPASYGATAPVTDAFDVPGSSEANPGLDDVLAAFGFGPVSFEAPSLSEVTGPAAAPGPEPSSWPEFSLNMG